MPNTKNEAEQPESYVAINQRIIQRACARCSKSNWKSYDEWPKAGRRVRKGQTATRIPKAHQSEFEDEDGAISQIYRWEMLRLFCLCQTTPLKSSQAEEASQ